MNSPDNYASETLIKSMTEKGKSKRQNLGKEEKYSLDHILEKRSGGDIQMRRQEK